MRNDFTDEKKRVARESSFLALLAAALISFAALSPSPAVSGNDVGDKAVTSQQAAVSDAAGNSGGLKKCISPEGGVSYSDGRTPGFCREGKLEPIESASFNVVGAQPPSVSQSREEKPRKNPPVIAERPLRPRPAKRAASRDTTALCNSYQKRLRLVRDRMRSGYKASQYNSLMAQERRAKEGIAQYCK